MLQIGNITSSRIGSDLNINGERSKDVYFVLVDDVPLSLLSCLSLFAKE